MELTPTIANIKKIGVVIDVQGFYLSSTKKFHAREIAFTTRHSHSSGSASIDPELPPFKTIYWKDRITINYVKSMVHGLPIEINENEKALPNSKLGDVIKMIQVFFTNAEQPLIGINNTHLGDFMKKLGFQYVNLQSVIPKRDSPYWLCRRHTNSEHAASKVCSQQKVQWISGCIDNIEEEESWKDWRPWGVIC